MVTTISYDQVLCLFLFYTNVFSSSFFNLTFSFMHLPSSFDRHKQSSYRERESTLQISTLQQGISHPSKNLPSSLYKRYHSK